MIYLRLRDIMSQTKNPGTKEYCKNIFTTSSDFGAFAMDLYNLIINKIA